MSHSYFKKYELGRLYEASLEISGFRSYNNKSLTSIERERLAHHLASRKGVDVNEIGPEDFKEAGSWKYPSIIAVCCDTGLRPIEVKRSNTEWINLRDQGL